MEAVSPFWSTTFSEISLETGNSFGFRQPSKYMIGSLHFRLAAKTSKPPLLSTVKCLTRASLALFVNSVPFRDMIPVAASNRRPETSWKLLTNKLNGPRPPRAEWWSSISLLLCTQNSVRFGAILLGTDNVAESLFEQARPLPLEV